MNCRYTTNAICICPVDGTLDVYRVKIESPTIIKVEAINEAVAALREQKIFQEDLTATLAKSLGASVRTEGSHSGVFTEVSAP